jgi:hypothetical protein
MLKSLEWFKEERRNKKNKDVQLINQEILLRNELESLLADALKDNDRCCIEVPDKRLFMFYKVLDDVSHNYKYIPDGNKFIITEIELARFLQERSGVL